MSNINILTQTPCVALQPFVRRFLVVESTTAHRDAHLPDTGLVAAFRFQGDCRLDSGLQAPRAALTGLWDTVRTHVHSQDHAVVIVSFTTTGAAAWLRQPLHEFANTTTDLAAVLGDSAQLDQLHDNLATAANHEQRIRLVEDLLLSHADNRQLDLAIAGAVALIEQAQAMLRIEDLAQEIGLSQSALERRFRCHVGVSPRKFASLVRLKNVLKLHARGADLTTIAHGAGYYDQAHFIKDFKRFTGLAPGSFFARSSAN
ncbi:MAG: helix-turn-helix domain-containing protein [Chloroflexi bacterium]|nr:helix-turn-helix domain-containing protein [Chloroflexota bacterium]